MRKILALILGKAVLNLTRVLKIGGGSAAPGLWALKIYPRLIEDLASAIPQTVIITGTNGKTTTARLLAHFAHAQGLKVIRNATGSNLARGIASTLIANYQLSTINYQPDLAIWELDEAAFNQLAAKLNPKAVVFLNAFRDQLDRYGEVDTVIKKWAETLEKLDPKTQIFLNGDDQNLSRLKNHCQGRVSAFTVSGKAIRGERAVSLEKIEPEFEAKNIQSRGLDKTDFGVDLKDKKLNFSLPLPGTYNVYNFLAAFSLALNLGISPETVQKSLSTFSSAFGRGEPFAGGKGHILLIKNPIGATQVFQTVQEVLKSNDRLLLALNDKLADGTDVSWIWDANFELLQTANSKLRTFCSGIRAYDLAVRLKYAGLEAKQLNIEPNLEKAFREAQRGLEGRLYVLPTYTAMLKLQEILASSGAKRHYWREE